MLFQNPQAQYPWVVRQARPRGGAVHEAGPLGHPVLSVTISVVELAGLQYKAVLQAGPLLHQG